MGVLWDSPWEEASGGWSSPQLLWHRIPHPQQRPPARQLLPTPPSLAAFLSPGTSPLVDKWEKNSSTGERLERGALSQGRNQPITCPTQIQVVAPLPSPA